MIDLDGRRPGKSDLEQVFRLFSSAISHALLELALLTLELALRLLDSDPKHELLQEGRALAFLVQAPDQLTQTIHLTGKGLTAFWYGHTTSWVV